MGLALFSGVQKFPALQPHRSLLCKHDGRSTACLMQFMDAGTAAGAVQAANGGAEAQCGGSQGAAGCQGHSGGIKGGSGIP